MYVHMYVQRFELLYLVTNYTCHEQCSEILYHYTIEGN